jgi:galactonate dehydratase
MRLYRVDVSPRTDWMVLRLDEAGLTGWGECSDGGTPEAIAGRLAAVARGEDPDPGSFLSTTVRGAIEQARCDLAARRAGVPLWKWLGGSDPGPVPVYANLNRVPGGREPGEVAATARAAVAAGFSRVKLAPFDVPGDRPLPELGLARVRAVRAAVGPDVEIMIDCHERLPLDDLEPVLGALAALRPAWLEDAAGIGDLPGLRRLRALWPLRLAGGEFASAAGEVRAAGGLLDVVMPDVKHAGGVRAALELARAAADGGAEVSFHNPSGPVATAFSAHLTGVVPGVLEYMFGEADWRPGVARPAERLRDGLLHLPDGPGAGLDLDPTHPRVTLVWSAP